MMRKGHLHALSASVLFVCACASGRGSPAIEEQIDAANPDPVADARPDSMPNPDGPPDACVPAAVEHLANPVFDLTPMGMGWIDGRDPATNALPGGPYPIISANPSGLAAQSAPYKAWLGGAAGGDVTPAKATLTDTLHQDFAIPAGATNVVVSGYYLVGTNEPFPGTYDTFKLDLVQTNGTVIENILSLTNETAASSFTAFSKTITANVAGQTVRLRAVSINDDVYLTNFFLDSFSVKATHCP